MACPMCENTAGTPVSRHDGGECIRIALAGNPNCGKTSTFNKITGSNQHVGNYPGVTIEKKEGRASVGGRSVLMVDLPGTYSLTAYSLEERVTREVLAPDDPAERPRAVIDVIDSGVLERGLFLAIQIREMGLPVVLACNMMDEARRSGTVIDLRKLSDLFGVEAVPTCARTGEGLDEAMRAALDAAAAPCSPMVISYGSDLDAALLDMVPIIEKRAILTGKYPARWTAIKLLEDDEIVRGQVSACDAEAAERLDAIRAKLADHLAKTEESTPEALISDYRYGYIHSLLKGGIVRKNTVKDRLALTDSLDRLLTNAILGPVIMVGVLYLMFQVTFKIGAYPPGWVAAAFAWLGGLIEG
ncbi:MAG: ferrous iron transporter B, partial [Mailhella sp.]|nr:ferrous iron transporter B [Mailhella sp.]